MSLDKGDIARVILEDVRDEDGELADPEELTLLIRKPNGEEETREYPPEGAIVRESKGNFYSTLELDEAGEWTYLWSTVGAPTLVERGRLLVGSVELAHSALLCDLDDVAGVLQVERSTLPGTTERSIEVASSWARRFLRSPNLGVGESVTVSAWDVRDDGYVGTEGVPTKVEVRRAAGGDLDELEEGAEWTYDGRGVRLRPFRNLGADHDPRYGPGRFSRTHAEVRVTEEVGDVDSLDPLVREGVAHAAAAMISRGPRAAKGLDSERIGDYAYARGRPSREAQESPFFDTAKSLLRSAPRRGGFPFVP